MHTYEISITYCIIKNHKSLCASKKRQSKLQELMTVQQWQALNSCHLIKLFIKELVMDRLIQLLTNKNFEDEIF